MDDNLAITLVFNTDQQMYISFEMTFFLYSGDQEQWIKSLEKISRKQVVHCPVVRVLGPDIIIENGLKFLEKWPKNQENMY